MKSLAAASAEAAETYVIVVVVALVELFVAAELLPGLLNKKAAC